jgi:predicted metal-binding protein
MSNHCLIVCEHCSFSAEQDEHEGLSGGAHLLNQLKSLYENWARKADLEIQTTGCLCICDHPCAIALVGTHKFTYVFGDLPPLDCAADLLTACELYLDSEKGSVNRCDLPSALRSKRLARIPPAP